MFVDGALGLTSAANRFIFQLLGGFSRLANFRRWFVAANDCQLHHLLHRLGIGSSKVHPHQRLFKGVLGAVAVIETGFGTARCDPPRAGFGISVLLRWRLSAQLSGVAS